MNTVNISTVRTMLNSGDSVDISVWKKDGSILHLHNVISLRYNFYGGWRNFQAIIEKAKESANNAGEKINDHFADVRKMISINRHKS